MNNIRPPPLFMIYFKLVFINLLFKLYYFKLRCFMFDENYLDNIYVHFKSNNDIYISTVPYDLPGDLYCHSLHYVISHFRSFYLN